MIGNMEYDATDNDLLLTFQDTYSVVHNQRRFLDFASRQEKKVLNELTTSCYEAYVQDLKSYLAQNDASIVITNADDNFEINWGKGRSAMDRIDRGKNTDDEPIYLSELVSQFDWQFINRKGTALTIYNLLMIWSQRWNLEADWVREYAISSMELWILGGKKIDERTWTWNYGHGPGYSGFMKDLLFPELSKSRLPSSLYQHTNSGRIAYLVKDEAFFDLVDNPELDNVGPSPLPPPPSGFPVWHDRLITRKDYLADVEYMAREAIEKSPLLASAGTSHVNSLIKAILWKGDAYCRDVKRYREAQGERGKTEEIPLRELTWTVAFQVQGRTFSEIARESNITTQAVVKKVRAVLKQLKLNERPDIAPGRPRGRKDSSLAPRQAMRPRKSHK